MIRKLPRRARLTAAALTLLPAILVATLLTQGSGNPEESNLAPGSAALRVSIDPETGDLVRDHRPPSAARAEFENAMSRSTDGLIREVHPDGSKSVKLQGRFQNASVARINEYGKVETSCVENANHAEAFRNGHAECSHDKPEVR